MSKLSIRDLDLKGKRLFIRVDFNVPLDGQTVTDDTRIRAALPTIRFAIDKGAKIILASHLGRPKGKPDLKYSLSPVAEYLKKELTGVNVSLGPDSKGSQVEGMVASLKEGDVLLLENLRFHAEEEKNDPAFARSLASLCDLYVNDAFGTAHRAHASTEGITHFVEKSAAGFLMEKELKYLVGALSNPERPYLVILGGAKVSDKISVIENLLKTADSILIGGAMAYTFLKSHGIETGKSLVEEDRVALASDLEKKASQAGVKLTLPVDHIVAASPDDAQGAKNVSVDATPADSMGLDIGVESRALYAKEISQAKTIIWNGPMGLFEKKPFDEGTRAVAEAVANASKSSGAISIVGGGDSVAAVVDMGLDQGITHISTGGGATLELLAGDILPGVAALTDK